MEEEVVPTFSLVLSLRQLMSLDFPRVALDKENKCAVSSSRPPTQTNNTDADIYTMTGRTNDVCSICTHTPSIISNDKKKNVIISLSPDHRRHANFLGLLVSSSENDQDGDKKIFCSVCLSTVTRLLRLREEMEEIQTRILTVFELRLKLKKESIVETPDEEPGVSMDHLLQENCNSDEDLNTQQDEEKLLIRNDATVVCVEASGQDSQIIVTRRSIRRKKTNLQLKNYLTSNDYDGALPPDSPPRVGDTSVPKLHKPMNRIAKSKDGPSHHKCTICGKVLLSRFQLFRHRQTRHESQMEETIFLNKPIASSLDHPCPKCSRIFDNLPGLRVHLQIVHLVKLRTTRECSICHTTFYNHINFEAHTHPDPTNPSKVLYICQVCGKGFKTIWVWKAHLKQGHNPNTNVAQCFHCAKVFPTESRLEKHTRVCSQPQEDLRNCTFASCGKTFSSPEARVEHEVASHMIYFQYKCYFCVRGFDCGWKLERHMKNHTLEGSLPEQNEGGGDLRYSCPKCEMPFDRLGLLKKHTSLVHPTIPPKKKNCSICNKGFLSEEFFKAHTHPDPTDPGNVIYTCQVCGKKIKSRESLIQHRRNVHLKIKKAPCQCEHCGKVFLHKRTLKKHSRFCSVPAEEQTKCTYVSCGRTFLTMGDRDDHERVVHKGLLSNKCYFCAIVFNTPDKLERHIRLHTLETPASCDKCGKEFTDDRYLKRHLISSACGTDEELKEMNRRRYGEYGKRSRCRAKLRHVCDQCGKRFSLKKGLTTHKQSRHGCQGNAEEGEKAKPIIKPIQQQLTRLFCSICNLSEFLSTEYFKAHTHPDPTNPENVCYTCQRCDKVCTTKETFKFHLFRHKKKVKQREVPPVKKKKMNPSPPGNKEMCLMCNRVLSPEDLKAHTHPDPTDPRIVVYTCQVCGKALKDKGAYRQHLHVHEKVGQEFQCHHCGKVMLGVRGLKTHVKVCSIPQEERGRCRFADCGKMFPSRAERNDHERVVHKRLVSNTCYFCGKVFDCLHKVERHLRIHTMETPFKCDNCGKDFPDERYLMRHFNSVCTSDEKARQEYVARKREYERQYRARPRLQCDQCDTRFGDKKLLASHIRREH